MLNCVEANCWEYYGGGIEDAFEGVSGDPHEDRQRDRNIIILGRYVSTICVFRVSQERVPYRSLRCSYDVWFASKTKPPPPPQHKKRQRAGKDVAPRRNQRSDGAEEGGGRHSPALALAHTVDPTKNDSCSLKIISFAFVTQL